MAFHRFHAIGPNLSMIAVQLSCSQYGFGWFDLSVCDEADIVATALSGDFSLRPTAFASPKSSTWARRACPRECCRI
jgi:hypothetical protein